MWPHPRGAEGVKSIAMEGRAVVLGVGVSVFNGDRVLVLPDKKGLVAAVVAAQL